MYDNDDADICCFNTFIQNVLLTSLEAAADKASKLAQNENRKVLRLVAQLVQAEIKKIEY